MADQDSVDYLDAQRDATLEAEKASQVARALERHDWEWLMSGPIGRRIVRRLFDMTRQNQSNFSTNALEMARANGVHQVGLALRLLVEDICPEKLDVMRQERKAELKKFEAKRSAEAHG